MIIANFFFADYSKQDSFTVLKSSATLNDAAIELAKGRKRILILNDCMKKNYLLTIL